MCYFQMSRKCGAEDSEVNKVCGNGSKSSVTYLYLSALFQYVFFFLLSFPLFLLFLFLSLPVSTGRAHHLCHQPVGFNRVLDLSGKNEERTTRKSVDIMKSPIEFLRNFNASTIFLKKKKTEIHPKATQNLYHFLRITDFQSNYGNNHCVIYRED